MEDQQILYVLVTLWINILDLLLSNLMNGCDTTIDTKCRDFYRLNQHWLFLHPTQSDVDPRFQSFIQEITATILPSPRICTQFLSTFSFQLLSNLSVVFSKNLIAQYSCRFSVPIVGLLAKIQARETSLLLCI